MKQPPTRRVSFLDHYVSLHSTPQKYKKSNQLKHSSQTSIDGFASFHQRSQQHMMNDPTLKIIEWRQQTHNHIIQVKEYQYSLVKGKERMIQVPICVQTQKIVKRLSILSNMSLGQSMLILASLLEGYSSIRSFFGFIAFDLRFCGINGQGKVKVWINSDFKNTQPEGKLITEESEAVLKIIQAVKKISSNSFSEFYCYYLRNARKNICDFKYTLSIVHSYCQCTKQTMPEKIPLYRSKSTSVSFANTLSVFRPAVFAEKRNHRKSETPNFAQKQKPILKIRQSDRPTSEVKKTLSENKIKMPLKQKQQNLHVQSNSQSLQKKIEKEPEIAHQFSVTLNPNSNTKHSSTSTNGNSNNKSLVRQSIQGLDWAFKTFNKVNKSTTHQSHTTIPIQKKDEELESKLNLLFEGIKEQCNSDSSPEKTGDKEWQKRKSIEQQIIKNNRWKNRIDSLFASKQIKESTIMGGEPEPAIQIELKTRKLDKWAKVIESTMPNQK